MIKPLLGPAAPQETPETDPVPGWRQSMATVTPEQMVKLLVDVSSWAQKHPKSAPAWTLLGDIYLKIRQVHAAERAYRKALAISPRAVDAREGLGLAMLETRQMDGAIKHLSVAHQLAPDNVEILIHLALAFIAGGDFKKAENSLQQAARLAPDHAVAQLNLGLIEAKRNRVPAAIAYFQRATQLQPDLWIAHRNLALAHSSIGELDQALACIDHLTGRPNAEAMDWITAGNLHLDLGDLPRAEQALNAAMGISASDPALYLALAKLHTEKGQFARAEGLLDTALALAPNHAEATLAKGYLHLLQHRFASGWDLHEARVRVEESSVRQLDLPVWSPQQGPFEGSVLVHAEQGLGATLMFAQALPDLIHKGQPVVLEVSTRLVPLLARSFPEATVVGRAPDSADLSWLPTIRPPVQSHVPIGSLPRLFRRELADFPARASYLKADPERVRHWQTRLKADPRPAIGLSWTGGLPKTGRYLRSVSLDSLAQALRPLNVRWISLQYGPVEDDVARAVAAGLALEHWPDTLADLDEVAALTCALDAVVTVCTTQAHLTGALGVRGMVLVPTVPNWRYGHQGSTMPWYPSLTLNRKAADETWADVLARAGQWVANLPPSFSGSQGS